MPRSDGDVLKASDGPFRLSVGAPDRFYRAAHGEPPGVSVTKAFPIRAGVNRARATGSKRRAGIAKSSPSQMKLKQSLL
jgi:hypothetical protein